MKTYWPTRSEHARRVAHPERQRRRVVDADIPRAAFERLQVAGVAITDELDDLARPRARAAAAIEEGDLVAARERVGHLVRAGEPGAAEDEDAQAPLRLAAADRVGGSGETRRSQRRQRNGGVEQIAAGHGHGACSGVGLSMLGEQPRGCTVASPER